MLKKKFLVLFFIITFNVDCFAKNNIFILVAIDDQILTNFDVKKEAEYLETLNPNLKQLNKDKIFEISKRSLIKEVIKRKEIQKVFDIEKSNPFVNDYLKEIYTKLNFNNEDEFKNYLLNNSSYTFDEIKKKLNIEIMWNELIYFKYGKQVKIEKEKLIKKIEKLSDQITKEYQISEIVFKKDKNNDLNSIVNKINKSILEIGFNNTANIFSISDSSKFGGKIGWINENNLSDAIYKEFKNLEEGEHTEPLIIGNNFLILKIEKIREKNVSIDKEQELEKMIKFETNKQLNQFSKIFFDRAKMNYSINEN